MDIRKHKSHTIPAQEVDYTNFVQMHWNTLRLICMLGLTALLGVVTSGCQSVAYYHQAAMGQWQIEKGKRSIKALINHPDTTPSLRKQFEQILNIRRFAFWHMNLPAENAYEDYVAIERDYVVWNVTACPEYSMEPHRWWYPFLGKLKYRGYFDSHEAHDYAQSLESSGYDVVVEGVIAYSTLGWFRDPIFDTFSHWSDVDVAELLFHELAHQRVFLTGHTEWNEAYAVVTARAGVKAWLQEQSRPEDLSRYEEAIQLEDQFINMVIDTKKELEKLYATFESREKDPPINTPRLPPALSPEEKAEQKQKVFDAFKEKFAAKVENQPGLAVYQ